MMELAYRERVELLLRIIPYIAKELVFGLKGGTAINLFLRNFPRLSVDIDLVYLPFDAREIALEKISSALGRIKASLINDIRGLQVTSIPFSKDQDLKLMCQLRRAQVKVEVNSVNRGHVMPVELQRVAPNVEEEFERFATMQILSQGEVYGGKICAALDRQHPRDLFDVKHLLDSQGLTNEIKLGFLCALLSHPRPIQEVIHPTILNQRGAFESQFQGMSLEAFSYSDHEETLDRLLAGLNKLLTNQDRQFLCSFKSGTPAWDIGKSYHLLKEMPAVQWKLLNIKELKDSNPVKHQSMLKGLREKLFD